MKIVTDTDLDLLELITVADTDADLIVLELDR